MNIDLTQIEVSKDYLFNVRKNLGYNEQILKFYKRLLFNSRYVSNASYREKSKTYDKYDPKSINYQAYEKVLTMENKISNMMNCNSLLLLNVYEKQKLKDFIKTNLCKDRFCANCKKVKQASRMSRFIPEIEKYKNYDLYHLTLTIPNCNGKNLSFAIDSMLKAFPKLIEYFKEKSGKKIRGLDFGKYGYLGAIRSLEVTFKGDSYHPHLHVLLALDYDIGEKTIVNKFSKRFGKITNKFSEFEILIQKIWYLLINGKKVTLNNINRLELGYSCKADLFEEDHYFEMFKYMTKTESEEGERFTYDNFLILYFQLKNVRQIQGYGCFFRIKDINVDEEVDHFYDDLVSYLDSVEEPIVMAEKAEKLYFDTEYKLISRKRVFNYIREIEKREKEKEVVSTSLKNG